VIGVPAHHGASAPGSVPLTSAAVMAAVRELAGATGIGIARQTGLPENRISEARTVLRLAPDLVDAVTAGRMGLSRAYRAAPGREVRSKKRSSSTGNGMTRVLFFSAATSTTVCSSRSCSAAGSAAMTEAAWASFLEA